MAISTDSFIEFFGTQDALDNTTSAVANNAMSAGTTDLNAWTNDDDAEYAAFTLEVTFGTSPTAGTGIDLYCALQDVVSTSDARPPTTTHLHYYLGTFPVEASTSAQFITIEAKLPNVATSQVYHFYLHNNGTGQSMSAGWDLHVTPKAKGPHA